MGKRDEAAAKVEEHQSMTKLSKLFKPGRVAYIEIFHTYQTQHSHIVPVKPHPRYLLLCGSHTFPNSQSRLRVAARGPCVVVLQELERHQRWGMIQEARRLVRVKTVELLDRRIRLHFPGRSKDNVGEDIGCTELIV